MKAATIIGAICFVALGYGVVAILLGTAAVTFIATLVQAAATRRILRLKSLWPKVDRRTWKEILGFGVYSWILNAAGVAFSQADRLLIAMMLGTASLTYYTLCLQITQQIHGLVGAAFSFLFPHISAKHEAGNRLGAQKAFRLAILVNVALSFCLTAPIVLYGKQFLTIWMGPEFAAHAVHVLVFLAVGFFALSLNVVPHFTLLGLGKVRFLSFANMAGGIASLVGAAILIPPLGLVGAAASRLFYGPVISMNYWKVSKSL